MGPPYNNPAVADFQNFFVRDFPYGTDINNCVIDQDIANAFVYVNVNINPCLFCDQASYTLGYLLLSAHQLVLNLRASSQGLNGQYNFLQVSKGVGAVSEGTAIPQRILDNPELAMLAKTNYGAAFLQLILPQLAGQMFSVCGTTRA